MQTLIKKIVKSIKTYMKIHQNFIKQGISAILIRKSSFSFIIKDTS